MQFQNKRFIILSFVGITIFIILIIFGLKADNGSDTNNATTYKDPLSGETLTKTPGKTSETYGLAEGEVDIDYLGFSKLLDIGTTLAQVDAIKSSIAEFSTKNNLKITEVSIDVKKIEPFVADDYNGVNFPIMVNRKNAYDIQVKYLDLDNVLFIVNKDKIKIFETNSTSPPDDPETIVY